MASCSGQQIGSVSRHQYFEARIVNAYPVNEHALGHDLEQGTCISADGHIRSLFNKKANRSLYKVFVTVLTGVRSTHRCCSSKPYSFRASHRILPYVLSDSMWRR